jgi:hypothetical protein
LSFHHVEVGGSDHILSHFSLPLLSEYIGEIIRELADFLRKEKWDILHLGPISGLYDHRTELREVVEKSFCDFCSILEKNGGVQTYYKLASTWGASFSV